MKQTLNICMTTDDFLPAATGVGMHVQCISRELAQLGHRVTVITSRRKGQPEFETWNGVNVHRTFTLKMFGFYQALPGPALLKRLITDCEPDIIHHHYLGLMLVNAHRIARSMGIPTVYTYHMPPELLTGPLPMRPLRPAINRQVRRFCNECDLVIVPSRNLASRLQQDGLRTPMVHLSNPVDLGHASAGSSRPEKRGFTVLFAGRLAPEKNIPYLIRGFAAFARQAPDAELWLAGDGGEHGRIESLVRDLGMADRTRFLGFLDHDRLAGCYSAADAFVLPSLMEAQPIAALEAMHFGLPVLISNRFPAAREVVDHGENGYLLDLAADSDLAARLAFLHQNPALGPSMGQLGRAKAASYRPGSIVEQLVAKYQAVHAPAAGRQELQADPLDLVGRLSEGALN